MTRFRSVSNGYITRSVAVYAVWYRKSSRDWREWLFYVWNYRRKSRAAAAIPHAWYRLEAE